MKVKLLHSFSKGEINEYDWDKPEIRSDQIEVQTKLCGVCRSDIGSYMRWEEMPYFSNENPNGILGTFGHEGLGIVTKIGDAVKSNVKVGDIVATWCDPAYADYYNVNDKEFVIVPEIHSRYILQPTACAINILLRTLSQLSDTWTNGSVPPKILLVGTGFMSLVIGQYLKFFKYKFDVAGSSNTELWEKLGIQPFRSIDLVIESKMKYDAVIDLSSNASVWYKIPEVLNVEGVLCYASTPTELIHTNFFKQCWNCYTILMPSPRNTGFLKMMERTKDLIAAGVIDVDAMWSNDYDRKSEYKLAFEDGANRTPGYMRGFLKY